MLASLIWDLQVSFLEKYVSAAQKDLWKEHGYFISASYLVIPGAYTSGGNVIKKVFPLSWAESAQI